MLVYHRKVPGDTTPFIMLDVTPECCSGNCNCPRVHTETSKEDDYDVIDEPSLPGATEVEGMTLMSEGGAGRSFGEVNTSCPNNLQTQDEAQTLDFLLKNIHLPLCHSLNMVEI